MAASLTLKLIAQTAGFQSQLAAAQKSFATQTKKMLGDSRAFQKIGREMKSLGASMTVAITAPVVATGGALLKMAADAEESENLFEVSMDGMAISARAWSERLREDLGLNAFEVRKQVSTFNLMFQGMGVGEEQAFDMAKGMTELTADMASFRNLAPDEIFTKLSSALSGEVEPLKRLGIIINETTIKAHALTVGIGDGTGKLTEQEKVLARYSLIMKQTTNDQGDLARTMGSLTNQVRIMGTQVKNMAVDLGVELIPAAQRFNEQVLKPMIEKIKEAIKWFKGLSTESKDTFIKMAAGLAVSGPIIVGLGILIASLQKIIPLIIAINGAILLNPVILAITAATVGVIGLLAATIVLTGQTKEVKDELASAFEFVKEKALELKTELLEVAEANKVITKSAAGASVETVTVTSLQDDLRAKFQEIARGKEQEKLGKHIAKVAQQQYKLTRAAKAHGKSQELLGRAILRNAQKNSKGEVKAFITTTDLKEKAVKGVADTIKLLWADTAFSFDDAWKNALNVFVDVMAQMIIQSIITGKVIESSMALATAGITLVLGLLASVFGGGSKKSAIQQATEDFLRDIKSALKGFEDEVLSSLEKITRATIRGKEALENIKLLSELVLIPRQSLQNDKGFNRAKEIDALFEGTQLFSDGPVGLAGLRRREINFAGIQREIIKNSKLALEAIQTEFKLKKEAINEIISLLKRESDFVKGLNRSITDVTRAFFSDTELFDAQKKDIQDLTGLVAVATGETRLALSQDLQSALLASFETAKNVFEGDPEQLKAWQQTVIKGLEGVKDSGKDAFQQLIDVQFEELNILKGSKVTQDIMETHLRALGDAAILSTQLLGAIAKGDTSAGTINALVSQMNTLFPANPIALATGGIVTKPTIAMIAEAGQAEAVIPLSKLGQFSGGGGNTIIASFPGIRDFRDVTVSEAESILTGNFAQAAENLDRSGVEWPMKSRVR